MFQFADFELEQGKLEILYTLSCREGKGGVRKDGVQNSPYDRAAAGAIYL